MLKKTNDQFDGVYNSDKSSSIKVPKGFFDKKFNSSSSTILVNNNIKDLDKQIINFFDSFFEKTNQDISNLKKGRQLTIGERALYFIDEKFVPGFKRTQIFMESDYNRSE
ncbi:hypothetical protein [Chryseobacterium lathyri]|uniref:Uncharacterized protein n=1 Tax=Chryseobacterium lathyri TaxID=395933 RepID=A0ABT9SKV7_9FLAO|nr:hypothetical protein [Chryseobacterium lathyri]MDP9960053.1 hypothetical protein [Chryseobacterium lathyri]